MPTDRDRPAPFLARLQAALPSLHPTERRLAESILQFPGDLPSYTASELARIAGVSNATVTRVVRKLDYESFEAARQAIRTEQQAGAALFRVGAGGQPLTGHVARHLEQSQSNLAQTFASLAEEDVDALATAIVRAPRLWVLGFRAGQPFARYFGWQVSQVLDRVEVLPRSGETLSETIAGAGPEDCAVFFLLRRAPRVATGALEALARRKTPCALIGDLTEAGADKRAARWLLPCVTAAAGPLFNHTTVMAMAGLIATRVIDESGAVGRQRLRAIEDLHGDLGEM